MIYGKLGRSQIKYQIWFQTLGFGRKLNDDKIKLSCRIYNYLRKISHPEKWLSCVQTILIEFGIPCANYFVVNVNEAHFKDYTKDKLRDVSIQQWIISMKNHSLCRVYFAYKYKNRIEPYIFTLKTKHKIELSVFQRAALTLVELREKITGVKETHCPFCNADEYHF